MQPIDAWALSQHQAVGALLLCLRALLGDCACSCQVALVADAVVD